MEAPFLSSELRSGGLYCARNQTGHLFRRRLRYRLVRDLAPRRSTTMRSATAKTSGMRWLIRIDGEPCPRSSPDEVEHLRNLADADRGGRLVHQHDPRRRLSRVRAMATAWRWPPDICLTLVARPRLGLQLPEEFARALVHRRVVEKPQGPDRSCRARGRERRWPPP